MGYPVAVGPEPIIGAPQIIMQPVYQPVPQQAFMQGPVMVQPTMVVPYTGYVGDPAYCQQYLPESAMNLPPQQQRQ